jgi:hypothetical protein
LFDRAVGKGGCPEGGRPQQLHCQIRRSSVNETVRMEDSQENLVRHGAGLYGIQEVDPLEGRLPPDHLGCPHAGTRNRMVRPSAHAEEQWIFAAGVPVAYSPETAFRASARPVYGGRQEA